MWFVFTPHPLVAVISCLSVYKKLLALLLQCYCNGLFSFSLVVMWLCCRFCTGILLESKREAGRN
jgi:hypothetical protein